MDGAGYRGFLPLSFDTHATIDKGDADSFDLKLGAAAAVSPP